MPRCRFFDDIHDYPQDECDRAYCREVLPMAKPRIHPLHLDPNPTTCSHRWEVYFSRMRVPFECRIRPGWTENLEINISHGLMLMADHTFSVCEVCGAVSYSHHELGGPILCLPSKRGDGCDPIA